MTISSSASSRVVASLPHPVLLPCEEQDTDYNERERKRSKLNYRTKPLSPHDHITTNDEVHSRIHFCPVVKAIVDTPQFQRLRSLKQLGVADYVYMCVNHTRFEHSVGVAHLAERLCKRLQTRQPNLRITAKDVLCVKLAGLCHDLGHGPYSHVYCDLFPKELLKHLKKNPQLLQHYENLPPVPEKWKHEDSSIMIIDPQKWKHEDSSMMMIDAALESLGLAIDEDQLDLPLRQVGDGVASESMRVYDQSAEETARDDILTSRDWIFIKECILGAPLGKAPVDDVHSGFTGRPYKRQEFLYDIVSNRHTGLDVDKMDYFARDGRRAEGGSGDIKERLIDEAVVAWGTCPQPSNCSACKKQAPSPSLHLMICYPENKMERYAMEFFHNRFRNHEAIYAHKTVVAASFMVCDILTLADPFFRIPTTLDIDNNGGPKTDGPNELPISRAMLDKTSYLRLRDSVLDQIMATDSPQLKRARLLIGRFWNRDLYKCAGSMKLDLSTSRGRILSEKARKNVDEFKSEILAIRGEHTDASGRPIYLHEDDFVVEWSRMHHGQKQKNPVMLMRFLPKNLLPKLSIHDLDQLPVASPPQDEGRNGNTPVVMQEEFLRVFCRDPEKLELLTHVFGIWKQEVKDEIAFTVDECSVAGVQDRGPAVSQEECETSRQSDNESYQSPFSPNSHFYLR